MRRALPHRIWWLAAALCACLIPVVAVIGAWLGDDVLPQPVAACLIPVLVGLMLGLRRRAQLHTPLRGPKGD